jgi:CubicO group peptidase (beta-lactamase class C family)
MSRLLIALLVTAASGLAQDLASRIENGLLPPYLVNGDRPVWKLEDRMRFYKTPGVSIAVIRGGKVVLAKGYGVLEAGGTARVDPDTLFQAASISKPVTAMAALHMSQFGNFTLEEDVNGKLKSWKVPGASPVTVRELLSHTAGMTVHGFPGYAAGAPVPTLVQVLDGEKPANTAPIRVDTEPGTKYRYSGGGYTVVQQLMIDRFGQPFPTVMQMTVLGPLGMKRSTYEQPLPGALAPNAARAHRSDGKLVAGQWHTYPEMAAAGLWTTPSDLSRFAIEVWNAARGQSNKVLEKASAVQMLTVQKDEYGLGLGIQGEGPTLRFSHGGANEGYRCYFVMHRESGNGVVIMANSDNGGSLNSEILRAIATAESWPDSLPEKKTTVPLSLDLCRAYEGRYRIGPDAIRITCESGQLVAYAPGRAEGIKLAAESEAAFFALDGSGPSVKFHRQSDGSVELEVHGQRVRRER